jgi:hypothetical protein
MWDMKYKERWGGGIFSKLELIEFYWAQDYWALENIFENSVYGRQSAKSLRPKDVLVYFVLLS